MLMMMRKLALLVLLATTSAHADQILYQNSFDTDTTNFPGTYTPFEFDPAGPTLFNLSPPSDSTASVQSGVVHISRGLTGGASSVPYSRPFLSLASLDLLGQSSFPDEITLSVEMGGTSGNTSWWSPVIGIGNIDWLFHSNMSGVHTRFCVNNATDCLFTPTGFFMSENVLHKVDLTVKRNGSNYDFSVHVEDGANLSNIFDASVSYSDVSVGSLSQIYLMRQGHGGGDAIFDNLTISSPIPEPNTALLLGFGLVGLGIKRRQRRAVLH
jgi:hypothetical protein